MNPRSVHLSVTPLSFVKEHEPLALLLFAVGGGGREPSQAVAITTGSYLLILVLQLPTWKQINHLLSLPGEYQDMNKLCFLSLESP